MLVKTADRSSRRELRKNGLYMKVFYSLLTFYVANVLVPVSMSVAPSQ